MSKWVFQKESHIVWNGGDLSAYILKCDIRLVKSLREMWACAHKLGLNCSKIVENH